MMPACDHAQAVFMSSMPTHLAVSIVADNPQDAVEQAASLPADVTLVEYRLDFMARVDVAYLARRSPRPAIFTCRPPREGGHFQGSERERLALLAQAAATEHWVDVEMDSLASLRRMGVSSSRIIGSHHDFQGMVGDWWSLGVRMRALGASVVKLVGMAQSPDDSLIPLAWLAAMDGPAIGIAMGDAGVVTRLLAPRFEHAFLTFASLERAAAPGQVPISAWMEIYGFHEVGRAAPLAVWLTSQPAPWPQIQAIREAWAACHPHQRAWVLPVPIGQVTAGLMLAFRQARVDAVIREEGVAVSSDLEDYGWSAQALAWNLRDGRAIMTPITPETISEVAFDPGK